MRIFGLKNCDTCRKAAKALGAELVDIRATPLDPGQIDQFYSTFGDALVNTRSTTWRGLSDADRALTPADLIAAHPSVMKRPVIEAADGQLHLGWGKDVQAALGQ
ncbi:ArsC/Spx/MgsR family protein [Gymnodinialimonas sp. 2305UL16-5]|uniref:arsenate reductase family protein n=1 Tax=Gymnodinialimonas mytili TaxID=3126503 RepID=UPI00309FDC21